MSENVKPQEAYPLKGPYSTEVVKESTQREQAGHGPFASHPNLTRTEGEGEPLKDPHRNFHFMSLVGLAYAILNSWTAMAVSLSVALPSGGPTAAISWICGWFATSGWVALAATAGSLAGQLITGVIALLHPNYKSERWHIFLIYIAYTLGACFLNIFGLRILPKINQAAIFWSLSGAVVIIIVCLSTASPHFQSGDFVFRKFINTTGWPNGVAWILGLLQSSFGLTGYDAVSHMVEEMPLPHINAPRTMMLAVCIGASSSFIFLICLLFSISDIESVNTSSAGALLESMYQATNSKAGAVCLQIFPIIAMAFTAQGLMTASSRMVYAFARDGGLPFSRIFSRMDRNGVPVHAVLFTTVLFTTVLFTTVLFTTVLFTTVLVIVFGCIYLGSSTALNAILSSSVVFLNVSYSIPILLVLVRGRHILQPPSLPEPTFTLGPILGPLCNCVGLGFTILTTVFFLFPPELPVSGTNMNYAVVVFGLIFIVSVITWIVDGRKNFIGPRDLGALLELARSEVDATKVNLYTSQGHENQLSLQENGSTLPSSNEKSARTTVI
ncbi:hypothetical protein L204_101362 [Cryptococcus depauperatus]